MQAKPTKSSMLATPNNNQPRVYIVLFIGLILRFFLVSRSAQNGFKQWLQNRVEISTPLTSWNRVLEGLYLRTGIGQTSSYSGDLVHEIPLMLKFYQLALLVFTEAHISLFFILLDCLNGFLIYQIARKSIVHLINLEQLNWQKKLYPKLNNLSFLISTENYSKTVWSLFAICIYLFNPFGLASCIGLSIVVIHNNLLLFWLLFLLEGNYSLALAFLAVHANISVYSAVLIVPSLSFIAQKKDYLNGKESDLIKLIFSRLIQFSVFIVTILGVNFYLENFNPRFVECTYFFILQVPDLVPNMGLFWYFFTEMFDHFLTFFTVVFQFNAFLYAIPLTVRLWNDPLINIFVQISLLTILKSYPNVSETSFYIALLVPFIGYLFPLMRNFLVYSCMLLVSIVLAPIMFYLWLGSGGGNANFYFAITLVYTTGQLFLLADVLYAHLKREFIKTNGEEMPEVEKDNGEKVIASFALD